VTSRRWRSTDAAMSRLRRACARMPSGPSCGLIDPVVLDAVLLLEFLPQLPEELWFIVCAVPCEA